MLLSYTDFEFFMSYVGRFFMPIRINSFMGKFGWVARKKFPMLASNAYLKMQFFTRSKSQKEYCDYFLNAKEIKIIIKGNISTKSIIINKTSIGK